ncbi:hypothetical protein FACS1894125_1560 [Actinomycetota bacterium]|nr:hypothetical protein FACS1894125_1560 [Actinomycetota bacterium]
MIIESLFVYPIIFMILALLFFICDIYYQKAWIDAQCANYAISIAKKLADPAGTSITKNGDPMYVGASDTMPYRFLAPDNFNSLQREAESKLKNSLESGGASALGFKPKKGSPNVSITKRKEDTLTSQIIVKVSYVYNIPMFTLVTPNIKGIEMKSSAGAMSTSSSIGEKIRSADLVKQLDEKLESIRTFLQKLGVK